MCAFALTCLDCHSTDIVKYDKSGEGKQRYHCRNQECLRRTCKAYTDLQHDRLILSLVKRDRALEASVKKLINTTTDQDNYTDEERSRLPTTSDRISILLVNTCFIIIISLIIC